MDFKGYHVKTCMGTARYRDDPESIRVLLLDGKNDEDLVDIRRCVYGYPSEGITMQKGLAEHLLGVLQYLLQTEPIRKDA